MTGPDGPGATAVLVGRHSLLDSPPADGLQGAGVPPDSLPRDPQSVLLIRVCADRIEVNEHLTHDRTAALVRALRGLGVAGEIIFRTPCG
ncbi:MAG: hypothetical protein Q8P31_00330 [Bacillota bacterium]|nr:hypothetical protein [Bacillota bacterium]